MQLTKEILEGDRKLYAEQAKSMQATVAYIDQLLNFMGMSEPPQEATAAEPTAEQATCCGGDCHSESPETVSADTP